MGELEKTEWAERRDGGGEEKRTDYRCDRVFGNFGGGPSNGCHKVDASQSKGGEKNDPFTFPEPASLQPYRKLAQEGIWVGVHTKSNKHASVHIVRCIYPAGVCEPGSLFCP